MNNAKKAAIFGILFVVLVLVGGFTHLYFLMFLGIVSLFTAWHFGVKNDDDFIKDSNEYFARALNDKQFAYDKKVFGHDRLQGLAINEKLERIAFVTRANVKDEYSVKLFKFNDILESKVITNKQTVTSTSIGSALTRGIGGTLLAGGIGGIIGGVTAKQKSTNKIKELTLEFVVNDLLNPRYTITFYKSDLPISESSQIIQDVEEWYRTFSVIINRNSQKVRSV